MDISSFSFQDAQNNIDNVMRLMPTLSGYIYDINNILDLFNKLFQQIQPTRTSISGNITIPPRLITLSGYLVDYTDISNYYITYIPPPMSTKGGFFLNEDISISGNLYCSSLYNYINDQYNSLNINYNILNVGQDALNDDYNRLNINVDYLNNYVISLSGKINNINKNLSNNVYTSLSGYITNLSLNNLPTYNDIFSLSGRITNIPNY